MQRDGLVRAPVVQPDRKHGLDEQPQDQRRGWAPAPMRVVLAQPKQGQGERGAVGVKVARVVVLEFVSASSKPMTLPDRHIEDCAGPGCGASCACWCHAALRS